MAPERLPFRVVTITLKQRDMLLDRLDGAGGLCIAESLGEEHGPEFEIAEREVRAQLGELRIVLQRLSPLAQRILADCLDGSTWCAQVDDGSDKACPALRGRRRTVESAHLKLRRAGLKLNDPVLL
jgi:hypothetical protein